MLTKFVFLQSNSPIAFAHRGSSGIAPENTLPAFQHSVSIGYTYLETDVHCTSDNILIAFHDNNLQRTTGKPGFIADISSTELSEYSAGETFSPDNGNSYPYRGKHVSIPTLASLFETFPHCNFNLDAKHDACIYPLSELLHSMNMWDRVCVGSFSDTRLRRLQHLCGGKLCTSMGPRAVLKAWLGSKGRMMPTGGAACIQVPMHQFGIPIISKHFIDVAHAHNLPIHVWTVNEPPTMAKLLELGIDGIMTDYPDVLKKVLTERHEWNQDIFN